MKEKKRKMYFEEKDIELCIDGMGIVFFSPKTTKDIPEGIDFFNQEYSAPADVSAHLKKEMWLDFVLDQAETSF